MASKEAAPAAAEQPAPAKKPILLIAIVALIGVAGGGAGTVFLLPKSAPPAAEGGHGAEAAQESEGGGGGGHGEAEGAGQGTFADRVVQLDPFVVNVSAEGYPRYLKVQVAFEMNAPEAKANLEERVAQVRDLTILLLSSKRLADLEDFEGKALLKDDLREQVNALLTKGRVESVLFTEFVVQ